MELWLPHIIRLYHVFWKWWKGKLCSIDRRIIQENVWKKTLYGEHDSSVVSMNSLNIHDANDMQSHKLGDAMFDEDDIFSPPWFDVQICYNHCMPPIYDDYIDESGFGDVMTLFNDESSTLEEVSIDYDKKSCYLWWLWWWHVCYKE